MCEKCLPHVSQASGPCLQALGARVVSERVPQRHLVPAPRSGLPTLPLCLAENSPGHGKSPDHKGRASSLLHKPEFPDAEMMEVLI
ncbi:Angiomotin-like protein 1 [Myotis davidii]|uniref:Angiomotin-like protein 1 n=1 Tax=Myotis davidii TaxID=225400 RepID=L5LPB5_MYODS|nr:Angiomotin-like protein 1 [Myotis davidii]